MPNYVSKEKKPVLNRETIKKDLKQKSKLPPLFRYLLLLSIALSAPIAISGISYSISLFFVENGVWAGIYYLFGSLLYAAVTCFFGWHLADTIFTPILIALDKFNVCTDTIRLKVTSEEKLNFSFRRAYTGREKYRYPSVLYFNNCGRYELCFDTRGKFGEYDSRTEGSAIRLLDSFELEKEYIVACFGKKKPRALIVYDPDKYDVQL